MTTNKLIPSTMKLLCTEMVILFVKNVDLLFYISQKIKNIEIH